jgi:hypothetical protein
MSKNRSSALSFDSGPAINTLPGVRQGPGIRYEGPLEPTFLSRNKTERGRLQGLHTIESAGAARVLNVVERVKVWMVNEGEWAQSTQKTDR